MSAYIGKTLLQIRNQILVFFAGNVNWFILATFRAYPVRQILGRRINESVLASNRVLDCCQR